MATLTPTSRGQITLRKEYMENLGIKPGDKIELGKAPDGKLTLEKAPSKGSWDNFFGCLAGQSSVKLSIEEMNEAIADAAAAEVMESFRR